RKNLRQICFGELIIASLEAALNQMSEITDNGKPDNDETELLPQLKEHLREVRRRIDKNPAAIEKAEK
ncbi:MAG: hypothetical protein LUC97_09945, partial [Clostridiales bacterium]|nr:hypothetical protein [Clostridiales bacterium]